MIQTPPFLWLLYVLHVSEPHLHGGDGFTILHVKELILLDEGVDFLFLNIHGTIIESFKGVPHFHNILTMWDRVILVYANGRNEYIPGSQIEFRHILHDVVNIDLRFKPAVDNDIPNIHIDRLNLNTHKLFPIVIIFIVKNMSYIVSLLWLFVHHIDSSGS
jgi:hypothetical protein